MVKIKDTHQEEVFQEGESSQVAMVAPIDDETAQRIFKEMEEQSNVLKKMVSHFTKLEEAKLKKAAHVEILDDEEGKGWDERDKANYKRNKQFEKLTAETVAMKEKMEKMQLAFCKAQEMDDYLYNMGGIISKTPIALPPKFKISDVEKFDGTGDPKQYVRRYLSIVEMKELDEKRTLHAFPVLFIRGASRWYYSLDPSKIKVWNELVELSVDQFIFNTMIDVTLMDLETTKQEVGETFFEYMTRWKGKASRMVNRTNEKDKINMIIKNLHSTYNSRLLSSPICSFGELCDCGTRIEDAINNRQLEKGESKPPIKKTYGGGVATSKAPNPMNVSTIIPQQTLAYPSFTKKVCRELFDLRMTLTQLYENLSSKGFIKPLDPTPMPNFVPPTWNLNKYWHFHQKSGHKTDNCFHLKHKIQELIDNRTFPNPNIITKPSIRKNPLPNYHRAPPSYQIWVQIDEVKWDCSKLIETIEVNVVEVQGIWDDKDEIWQNGGYVGDTP